MTICTAKEFHYKNVISNSSAFAYINLRSVLADDVSTMLEFVTNNTSYTINTANIINITALQDAITLMFTNYTELTSRFSSIIIDDHCIFINGDADFVISHVSFGSCGGAVHTHVVDEIIQIQSGDDIEQYSIVFAKIDETAKCRPFDIEWKLYENSGNDINLVTSSTNYFFAYILKDKSSYSLELLYHDRIVKPTLAIDGDNYETPPVIADDIPDDNASSNFL
jgi:hypothetical protein